MSRVRRRVKSETEQYAAGIKKLGKEMREGHKAAQEMFQGVHCSRWNFWKDGVSSSVVSSWLTCREQTRLALVEGWRARQEPIYFAFGTCVHWVLEQLYSVKSAPGASRVHNMLTRYSAKWRKEVVKPTEKQLEQHELVLGLVAAILPTYATRWAGDWTGKYPIPTATQRPSNWVSLERRFRVEFEFSDGKKVQIVGARDGVFKDRYKRWWLLDTKCLSVILEDNIEQTLPMDLQFMLYLWATWKETGVFPQGLLMNIVRRPGHRIGKTESLREFLDRVRGDIEQKSRWPHFFHRFQLAVTNQEIRSWERDVLEPILMDMRNWWEGTAPHYINPQALVSKYGRATMFEPIVHNDFSGCYQVERPMDYHERLV